MTFSTRVNFDPSEQNKVNVILYGRRNDDNIGTWITVYFSNQPASDGVTRSFINNSTEENEAFWNLYWERLKEIGIEYDDQNMLIMN
jgi:hypothetical protein